MLFPANEHIARARNRHHPGQACTTRGRQMPLQATTRTSQEAWPLRRGYAKARPPKAGKVMRRSLGGVPMQHRLYQRVFRGY